MPVAIRALYYDGRVSTAQAAIVAIGGAGTGAQLIIQVGDRELQLPVTGVDLGERVGATHRHLVLPEGAAVEVLDNADFDAALSHARLATREASLRKLEGRWRYALLALVVTLLGSLAFLRYGLPALASRAVRFIPPAVDALIGADTLKILDQSTFHPSKLSPQRQDEVRQLFREVAAGASPDSGRYRLEFRDGGRLGANAFALPSGIVVITDQLTALAVNDDELRGVFAHEVGHLVNRHAMRMLVQGSAAALLVVGIFGDVTGASSLAITAPTVLVNAAYSRDFERQADEFAFDWMSRHRIPPERLGDLLERLSRQEGSREVGFLASHPALEERLRASRAASHATPAPR